MTRSLRSSSGTASPAALVPRLTTLFAHESNWASKVTPRSRVMASCWLGAADAEPVMGPRSAGLAPSLGLSSLLTLLKAATCRASHFIRNLKFSYGSNRAPFTTSRLYGLPGKIEGVTDGERQVFPGESAEYRAARDRLLEQEIGLRRAMETVAAARRDLPPGGVVPEDYVFTGIGAAGSPTEVRLSELFEPGKDSLVIYSMMFPRDPGDDRPGPVDGPTARLPVAESPCPSCTALLDQLDGAAEHVSQWVNLVAVAKSPLPRILDFAAERGWRRLRLLSCVGNTYNRDYLGETTEGHQRPMLNVFHRDGGTIRHFWGSELLYAPTDPGQDPRHVGTIEPLWNLFDLTPDGRPTNWDEQLRYE